MVSEVVRIRLIDRLDRIIGLKTAEEVTPPQIRDNWCQVVRIRLIDRLDRIIGFKTAEGVTPPKIRDNWCQKWYGFDCLTDWIELLD
jgi:predicted DNA-binding transcriptional regulator YafY